MAYRHVYVDPNATDTPEDGTTWGKAYASLNAAEQAEDNTGDIRATGGSNEIVVFHCRASGGTADTTVATISGWTTDSGGYIVIVADAIDTSYGSGSSETTGTGRHHGVWSTSHYRLAVDNAIALYVNEDYVRVDGLQVAKTSSDANLEAPFAVAVQTATTNQILVSNCIFWGDDDVNYTQPCVYLNDADLIVVIWNCIAYSSGGASSSSSCGIQVNAVASCALYGCTFIGAYYGIRVANNQAATAKNCYFHGATADRSLGTSATITSTTSASSSTNFDVDSIPHDTTTFTNVTAGSENYTLVAGSGLIGVGTTLTDDPPGSTALGVDIIGTTRS